MNWSFFAAPEREHVRLRQVMDASGWNLGFFVAFLGPFVGTPAHIFIEQWDCTSLK